MYLQVSEVNTLLAQLCRAVLPMLLLKHSSVCVSNIRKKSLILFVMS